MKCRLFFVFLLVITVIQTVYWIWQNRSYPKRYIRFVYVEVGGFEDQRNETLIVNPLSASYITHAIYAFAILDRSTYEGIIINNEGIILKTEETFQKVLKFKKYGVKVILGLGGWDDSEMDYRIMLNDKEKRAKFAVNVANFLIEHGFHGLDVDLEYPCCWKLNCQGNCILDRINFTSLLRLLRYEFDKKSQLFGERLLLTVAVYHAKYKIPLIYEVREISQIVDYINVISYEFHNSNEKILQPPAAFTTDDLKSSSGINVRDSMETWLKYGAPREKLIVGMQFHANSYTLRDKGRHCIGDPASGPGVLTAPSFMEIVDVISTGGWEVVSTPYATFATKQLQWLSYDDIPDVARKAKYVTEMDFAGVMIWSIEKDYLADGPCGRYPLLSTIHRVLNGFRGDVSSCTERYTVTKESICKTFNHFKNIFS